MSKFIRRALLFFILFFLPLLMLEYLLRLPAVDSYSQKHYLMKSTAAENEVLILGNSLTWTGLNPNHIAAHSVNLANFQQAFYHDYLLLKKCIEISPKLKTVILPLSRPSFFSLPTVRSEQLYSVYWNMPALSGKKSVEYYSAVMAHGLEVGIHKVLNERQPMEDKGWGAFNIFYDGNEKDARSEIEHEDAVMDNKHFPQCTDFLKRIIELCAQQKLRLILCYPPYPFTINRLLKGDLYEEKMRSWVSALCEEQSLEIYDFNKMELFPLNAFRDPLHLNIVGSEQLSGIMKQIIEEPAAYQHLLVCSPSNN